MGSWDEESNSAPVPSPQSEFVPPPHRPAVPPTITDSPWFWLLIFSAFGLLVLLTAGPKYSLRQGGIETRFQNRETARAWDGADVESQAAVDATRLPRQPGERDLRISLRPLFIGIGAIVAVGLIGLSLFQLRQRKIQESGVRNQESAPLDPALLHSDS